MSEKCETEQGEILLLPELKDELMVLPAADGQAMTLPEALNLPKLITHAGEPATLIFVNYFTA